MFGLHVYVCACSAMDNRTVLGTHGIECQVTVGCCGGAGSWTRVVWRRSHALTCWAVALAQGEHSWLQVVTSELALLCPEGSANSHVQILCRFIWFCVLLISALASLAIQSVLFHLQELFIWWSLWPLISSFIPLWSGKTQEMISLLLVYWPPLWVYFRQDSIPVENNVCSVFVRWKIL